MKIRFTVLGLGVCALAAAAETDAKLKGNNILSCETYSFRELIRAGKLDMISIPAFYKQIGIKGISYNDMFFKTLDDTYIDQVKEAVRKAGRVVTGYVIEGNLAVSDATKRKEQIEADKKKMRAAHRLGARVVRINVGGTGKENADDTAGVERVVAAFREELVPLARSLKMRITIENHGGVSKTAANIVRIIKQTDPKVVGSLVDFGNWPAQPPELRYSETALVAPFAFTTHVKVNRFTAAGEAEDYDFPRMLQIMKKAGYKGPISIEYEGKEDPVQGVAKSKALILKYW